MSNATGKMMVRLEDGGWMIDHEGPVGDEVQALFDTKTLPSPFLEQTPIKDVIETLQTINPNCDVVEYQAPAKPHTPGPWEYSESGNSGESFNIWSGKELICGVDGEGEEEEQAQNARLIASAPELLAALEETATALHMTANVDCPLNLSDINHQVDLARQAIARATGKETQG